MEDETTKKTSMKCFLKCWYKESKVEYRKWLTRGLYGVAIIVAIAIAIYVLYFLYSIMSPVMIWTSNGFRNLLSVTFEKMVSLGSVILSFLMGIAWYWYVTCIAILIPAFIAAGRCFLRNKSEEKILKYREDIGFAFGAPGIFITLIGGAWLFADLIWSGGNILSGTGSKIAGIGIVLLMTGVYILPEPGKK